MKRNTLEFWSIERDFIRTINPIDPGKSFADDPQVFARYCNMQAKFAWSDGMPMYIVDSMLQSRDTAYPTFRSAVFCNLMDSKYVSRENIAFLDHADFLALRGRRRAILNNQMLDAVRKV